MPNPPIITQPRARIGLLGGSFNPPHNGHRDLSLAALEALSLDQIWWLVSPSNPQKKAEDYADYEARLKASEEVADHPRIHISDFERQSGTQYSFDTIAALTGKWPKLRFVWLMGADNLASFHTWRNWQDIFNTMPIAVFNRPGFAHAVTTAPASLAFSHARLPKRELRRLARHKPPAWGFIRSTYNSASSTNLREKHPKWQEHGSLEAPIEE